MHNMDSRLNKSRARRESGVTLLEVLVTMFITSFALLGLAGMIGRTTASAADSAQRARALVLIQDMSGRVANTRNGDWSVVVGNAYTYGGASGTDCTVLAGASRQACEWGNLVGGAADKRSDSSADATGFRGCIRAHSTGSGGVKAVRIIVAWASMTPGVAPSDDCGLGEVVDADAVDPSKDKDAQRRTASTVVWLPSLSGLGLETIAE